MPCPRTCPPSYAHHVLHGLASFEEVPPDAAAVGFRFGRWVDTVLMRLSLGPGDGGLPDH